MDNNRAINIMKYLIAKYTDDQDLVFKLYNDIDCRKDDLPVKGIMYEFLDKKKRKLDDNDSDLLSDLVFYYG